MTHTSRTLSLDIWITTKISHNTPAALRAKSFRCKQLLARLLLVVTKVNQTLDTGEIVRTVLQVFELWVRHQLEDSICGLEEFCRHDDTCIHNAINIVLIAMFNKQPGIGRRSVCIEPSCLFFTLQIYLIQVIILLIILVITWTT